MHRLIVPILHPRALERRIAMLALLLLAGTLLLAGAQPWAPHFIPAPPADKLMHMVAFGGLASLSWIVLGGTTWLVPILTTLVIGLADETQQMFSAGRTASLHDLAADFAGAVLAVTLLELLRRLTGAAARDQCVLRGQ